MKELCVWGSTVKYGNVRYIQYTMATTLAQTGLLQHPLSALQRYLLTIERVCLNLHLIQMQLLLRDELKNSPSPFGTKVFMLLFVERLPTNKVYIGSSLNLRSLHDFLNMSLEFEPIF